MLAQIMQTLAMIRLRSSNLADVGRGLTDEFLIKAHDLDLTRLQIRRKGYSGGWFHLYRMRIAHEERQVLAFHFRPVPDPLNFQDHFKAPADPLDHVGEQGTGGAMQGTVGRLLPFSRAVPEVVL